MHIKTNYDDHDDDLAEKGKTFWRGIKARWRGKYSNVHHIK